MESFQENSTKWKTMRTQLNASRTNETVTRRNRPGDGKTNYFPTIEPYSVIGTSIDVPKEKV